MREFLGISKALQSIKGEPLNNTSKLTEINKQIKRDTKKLEEVENDPTYTDEQIQLYRDTEKQARLQIRNIVTKSERSLNASCKNYADYCKSS